MEEEFVARKCEILVGWPYTATLHTNIKSKNTLKAAMSFVHSMRDITILLGLYWIWTSKRDINASLRNTRAFSHSLITIIFFTKAYIHKKELWCEILRPINIKLHKAYRITHTLMKLTGMKTTMRPVI